MGCLISYEKEIVPIDEKEDAVEKLLAENEINLKPIPSKAELIKMAKQEADAKLAAEERKKQAIIDAQNAIPIGTQLADFNNDVNHLIDEALRRVKKHVDGDVEVDICEFYHPENYRALSHKFISTCVGILFQNGYRCRYVEWTGMWGLHREIVIYG